MTERIKVLHLISSLSVGGAERLILGLADRIDRSRFELHVCSLGVVRGNVLQPDFERQGIPVYVIGSKLFYDVRSAIAVARYARRHQIDIIHTHLGDADVIGRVVGRFLRVPVVSTLHNEPRDYNRQRVDRRWLTRLTTRFLAPHLIAVSQRIRTMFVEEWNVPQERITMVYNAVPMDVYATIPEPSAQTRVGTDPVITNIGRLSPQKAQHDLLEAAKLVLEQRPDARFMIVGQGRLEQALKEQAQSLGIADRITFAGLRLDIPAVLEQSDIFVLSSLWEGLPLTAVEAMAAARPVVLTDVGGNRELVESGVQGLIVPPSDVPALAEALLKLLNDALLRDAMGQAGRARVHHDFSIDTFAAQHEALYQKLHNQHRSVNRQSRLSANNS